MWILPKEFLAEIRDLQPTHKHKVIYKQNAYKGLHYANNEVAFSISPAIHYPNNEVAFSSTPAAVAAGSSSSARKRSSGTSNPTR